MCSSFFIETFVTSSNIQPVRNEATYLATHAKHPLTLFPPYKCDILKYVTRVSDSKNIFILLQLHFMAIDMIFLRNVIIVNDEMLL